MRRDGCTQHQARLKATAQMPMSLKESRATFVINNSGSMQDTVTQATVALLAVFRAWLRLDQSLPDPDSNTWGMVTLELQKLPLSSGH